MRAEKSEPTDAEHDTFTNDGKDSWAQWLFHQTHHPSAYQLECNRDVWHPCKSVRSTKNERKADPNAAKKKKARTPQTSRSWSENTRDHKIFDMQRTCLGRLNFHSGDSTISFHCATQPQHRDMANMTVNMLVGMPIAGGEGKKRTLHRASRFCKLKAGVRHWLHQHRRAI